MKVLVTGDREWTDGPAIKQALLDVHATSVVEGECRGADTLARNAAFAIGLPVYAHPADWAALGKRAGPARNQEMLDKHKDIELVLAFHDALSDSRGTLDMVVRSLAAKKTVTLFRHAKCRRREDGAWVYEGGFMKVATATCQEELSGLLSAAR